MPVQYAERHGGLLQQSDFLLSGINKSDWTVHSIKLNTTRKQANKQTNKQKRDSLLIWSTGLSLDATSKTWIQWVFWFESSKDPVRPGSLCKQLKPSCGRRRWTAATLQSDPAVASVSRRTTTGTQP